MKNLQPKLKKIFNLAKDGDALIFKAAGINHAPMELATGGEWTHCGTVWNVERKEGEMSFNLSEQTFFGGKFDRVKISLVGGVYAAHNYHRLVDSEDIFLKRIPKKLTKAQHRIGLADAINQIGKRYGYLSLFLGFSFLEKILPQSIEDKLNKYLFNNERVCSPHVAIQFSKMSLIEFKKEMFYSPTDIHDLDFK